MCSSDLEGIAGWIRPLGTGASLQAQIDHAVWSQNVGRLMPNRLFTEIGQVLMDPRVKSVDIQGLLALKNEARALVTVLPVGQSLLIIWPQVVALIAATSLCFGVAYVTFMRQEVRA